jgi:small subunit ribosomal protein S25e
MGGSKNKSPAQKQKTQTDESTKKAGDKKKGKKKDKSEEGSSKAEITVLVNEEQAMKFIKSAKVITVQELARQLGVKISAANAFLIKLLKEGAVKRIGGFSGHHIYQPISA